MPRSGILREWIWTFYMADSLFWDTNEILADIVHTLQLKDFKKDDWHPKIPLVEYIIKTFPDIDAGKVKRVYTESINSAKTHCGVSEFLVSFKRTFPDIVIRIVAKHPSLDLDIGTCIYNCIREVRNGSFLSLFAESDTYVVHSECKLLKKNEKNNIGIRNNITDNNALNNNMIALLSENGEDGTLEAYTHWHYLNSEEIHEIGLTWRAPKDIEGGYVMVRPLKTIIPKEYIYTMELWRKYIPISWPQVEGVVVAGKQRGGSLLGIPTANLQLTRGSVAGLMGVLSGTCRFTNGNIDQKEYECVVSIGFNPYFAEHSQTIEVHLFNKFSQDFYGATLSVDIYKKIRPQTSFATFEHLVKSIQLDCEVTRE